MIGHRPVAQWFTLTSSAWLRQDKIAHYLSKHLSALLIILHSKVIEGLIHYSLKKYKIIPENFLKRNHL